MTTRSSSVSASDRDQSTLPMTVGNMSFMLDRLGEDCSPLQFLRELTQNSIEAILKTREKQGEVVWDVDWNHHTLTGVYKLCVVDNGVGMTGDEMVTYINALSSSIHTLSKSGNYGVGAKIAAAPRNHAGLVYLSWKDGIGYMVHLWRDPDSGIYGLRQFERPDGTYGHWVYVEDTIKPAVIHDHGTAVVLLGGDVDANTIEPPAGTPSYNKWIARYLNTRYYRFPAGLTVKAREGWMVSDSDSNKLRTLTGQKPYVDKHALSCGTVPLFNAKAHWWILKDEEALNANSGFVASSGHVAALYQDELYEMLTARAGVARLQSFGIIWGHQRVVIYVEPENGGDNHLTSNTARTHLLVNGDPLPWGDWAAEFRDEMPKEIRDLMEQLAAGAAASDHKQTIRERLKQIRDLFRISRYRPAPKGKMMVDADEVASGGKPSSTESERGTNGNSRGGGRGGRAGDVYGLYLAARGIPGEELRIDPDPTVRWVTAAEGTRTPPDLEDRAAKYIPQQNLVLANGDFRGFVDMIDRWAKRYDGVAGAREIVQDVVREWFEQQLIESVIGTQALRGSRHWTVQDLDNGWSEESLTAAVMPRYHIDLAVKRALGAKLGTLKEKV
jgi:hypothetical protein